MVSLPPADQPRFDLRLLSLLIGVVLSTVDSSALNLALPSLAAHFGVTASRRPGRIFLNHSRMMAG